MRKRFLVLALVLAVVATALSAAAYARIGNHIVLHGGTGAAVSSRTLTVAANRLNVVKMGAVIADATGPYRPAGVPANASYSKITLHGGTPGTKRGMSPAIGDGTWTCDVWQYAWKYNSTTMQGNAAYNCTGATQINFQMYADYCAPLLWGCTWQNKNTFSSCNYINPTSGACPKSGNYNLVYNIKSGQLWRERAYVCAWGPPGTTSMCGTVSQQVQF